jgi:hypothetical protein
MMNETTENFLKVMAEFGWPELQPVTYRLYHNADGTPKFYTMEDLPGDYILVDRETYVADCRHVRVVQGKLIFVAPTRTVKLLRPGTDAGTACHPQDVAVVVADVQPHTKWSMVQHETH